MKNKFYKNKTVANILFYKKYFILGYKNIP